MPPLSGATNHNGGVIAFGSDGKLWAVVGENANPSLSQNPLSPLGKVLRMNSDGTAPTDNPFYGNPAWFNLTYTYGHRNMFGLAFHPVTHRAYVTENGPACNDEINLLTAGDNYGWGPNNKCSTPPPPPSNTNQDGPNPVLPIWWWGTTICPTNAAIYGGPYFPAWQGDLFMGDCNTGRFHRLHLVPPNYDSVASDDILWTAPASIIEVEVGPDGVFWLTTPTTIYRYTGEPPAASFTATPNPVVQRGTATFDASSSSDPDGTIVSFAWDFGDRTNGSGKITSHPFASAGTYNVTLIVKDNESLNATVYRDVVVQPPGPGPQPPVADFAAEPSLTSPGSPVTFNASRSSDPNGTIVSYTWEFGDSTVGSGVITTHSYANPGVFTVNLTVTDNRSLSSNATHQVTVDAPPHAAFQFSPGTIYIGTSVSFDGSGSTDTDGTIASYRWDFGDRSSGTGVQASHAYAAKGVFGVRLTVADDPGLSNSTTREITVGHRAPQITSSTPGLGRAMVDASPAPHVAIIAWDPDGDLLTYTWRVDSAVAGGNASALNFASAAPGPHTVNVTLSDGSLVASREWNVTVVANGFSSLITSWPFFAFVFAVVAATLLVWLVRRKRKREAPPRLPPPGAF